MASPSDKPSWLHLSIKLSNRDADYMVTRLFGKVNGVLAAGTALGGKLPLRRAVQGMVTLLRGVANGVYEGNVFVSVLTDGGTRGAAVITPTYANNAGKTIVCTYSGLAITFTEAGAGVQGFLRGANLAATCAAIVAAFNTHPILKDIVVATTNSTTVTLTSKTDSAAPFVLSTSDGTAYAFTQFTGGTLGTARLFRQHLLANRNA